MELQQNDLKLPTQTKIFQPSSKLCTSGDFLVLPSLEKYASLESFQNQKFENELL